MCLCAEVVTSLPLYFEGRRSLVFPSGGIMILMARRLFSCVIKRYLWLELGLYRRMISLSSLRSYIKIVEESKSLAEGARVCVVQQKVMTWKQMYCLPVKAEFPCVRFVSFISLYQKYIHWIFYIAGGGKKGVYWRGTQKGRRGWFPALGDSTGGITMHTVAPRSLSYVVHSPVYWCGDTGSIHSTVLSWQSPWLISGC